MAIDPRQLARKELDVPRDILMRLRSICARLPGVDEERAWVGHRWVVAKKTFAQVVSINNGWPPAYAKAAGENGPICVLTFRSKGRKLEPEMFGKYPFFRPEWFPNIVGLVIDDSIEWSEVNNLLTTSYCVLAPKGLAGQVLHCM